VAPPKKKFGQHFLISPHYARRIAAAVPADSAAEVLEIGAGRGALSVHLAARFPRLHIVEMDRDLVKPLRERLGTGTWILHECNVLELNMSELGNPLHVVGNLPYNIAAVIIKKVLMGGAGIASCTFMVQREVAERITAEPHSRQNGFLSIFCQFFGKPRILFHVPAGAFYPKPKVESSVFQMTVSRGLEAQLPRMQWLSFFAFVDRGFSMRRKMLINTLGAENGKAGVCEWLKDTGLPFTARPEDLSANEWLRLFKRARRI